MYLIESNVFKRAVKLYLPNKWNNKQRKQNEPVNLNFATMDGFYLTEQVVQSTLY